MDHKRRRVLITGRSLDQVGEALIKWRTLDQMDKVVVIRPENDQNVHLIKGTSI